ncbi:protein kinase-like protein [Nonomuraea fuscirosea]|uniref:Protein kinase-like protein n=1 Tax=Nonomuraea fuscirosea TaxID=1291556 RepID=A0A2T0MMH7_9ACTN|nr:protein kinase-like protein [Nonomuraea fuscirosea]
MLQDAQIEAAAILAQARSDAEQIITSAQLIASATLQRARSQHLPQRRSQAGQRTQPAHALTHSDGDGPAPIMVLNDRWRIYAPLNADPSAMATLYKAYELADPATTVVAKVFHQANSDPQRFRTFLREVRGMRLHHPHIGQIIDSGQDRRSQAVYLISPLYQPGSLNLHLQQQAGASVSLKWSLWVVDQVLAGLQAAALSNIIHLDIKPQNIVLDGLTNIRIIDWGMSQLHQAGKSVSTVSPGGTKWFASPEQLGVTDAAPSGLSDLYGVGALAYWLLTGLAPLRRELETAVGTDADLLQVYHLMQAGTRPERTDHLTPDVPEQLGRLIDQWLSYTPADRIPHGMNPTCALGWARTAFG